MHHSATDTPFYRQVLAVTGDTEKQNLTSIKKFLNNFFKLLPIKNLQNNQIKSWSNRWKLFLSPLFCSISTFLFQFSARIIQANFLSHRKGRKRIMTTWHELALILVAQLHKGHYLNSQIKVYFKLLLNFGVIFKKLANINVL